MTHSTYASTLVLATSCAAMAAVPVPVAWWTFAPSGDVPGLIEDVSGNGFDAEVADSASVSRSAADDAPGGAALVFSRGDASDGIRELVAAPLPGLPTAAPFTLSAWIRVDGAEGVVPLLSRTTDPEGWSDGFVLFLADGVPGFAVGPGADQAALADADWALRPGDWSHLALVSDGVGDTRLFLDGMEAASASAVPLPADAPLAFGPMAGFPDFSPRSLADVRLFASALPSEWIAELALGKRQTRCPTESAEAPVAATPPPSTPSVAGHSPAHPAPRGPDSSPQASAQAVPIRVSAPILRVWTPLE